MYKAIILCGYRTIHPPASALANCDAGFMYVICDSNLLQSIMASCLQINIYQKHPDVGLSLKASGVRGDQVVICKFTSLSAVLQLFFHIKC